jgi:dolichyl-diphosphooligosaccharide---protein glycosyltransferase
MSRPQRRGKLRNPPRGRQYAYVAIAVVLLVAGGSGAYLYATHAGPFYVSGTSTSSSSSSANGSNTSSSATSSAGAAFNNTPCTASTTTSSKTTTGTYALICTNLGLIEVQLFPADAPKTVENFVSLAQSGFYNDLVWHRIVPGFVIQSGDPNTKNGGGDRSTWGSGTSGTSVPFEDDGKLHNTLGTVAMASTGARVGGSSQFYINLADNSQSLDGSYAVFGTVINGLSVVQALGNVPTSGSTQQPVNPSQAYIVSVTIQNTP